MGGFKPGGVSDHLQLTNIGVNTHDQIDSFMSSNATTEAATTYYVNGDTGNDGNDGLSSGTALKTLGGLAAIFPKQIYHNIGINLSGAIEQTSGVPLFDFTGHNSVYINFEGGSSVTVVDDNTGSNYTSDTGDTSTIGIAAGAGWTANQHQGYWVEIIDGALAGQKRTIKKNTTGVLTVTRKFTADPTGSQFRIVKPATILKDNSTYLPFQINANGRCTVTLSRFIMENRHYLYFFEGGNEATIYLSSIIFNQSGSVIQLRHYAKARSFLYYRGRDTTNFNYLGDSEYTTCSFIASGGSIDLHGNENISIYGMVCKNVQPSFINSIIGTFGYGSRFEKGVLFDSSTFRYYFTTSADYTTTEFTNDSGNGIDIVNSKVVNNTTDVSALDASGHGIEVLEGGIMTFDAAMGGSGNNDHGAACSNGGKIITASGVTPTLTGTNGNIKENTTTKAWAADTYYGPVYADQAGGASYAGHEQDAPQDPASAYTNELDTSISDFTWGNRGDPTGTWGSYAIENNRLWMELTGSAGAWDITAHHQLWKTAPTQSFEMETCIGCNNHANYHQVGIYADNGSSATWVALLKQYDAALEGVRHDRRISNSNSLEWFKQRWRDHHVYLKQTYEYGARTWRFYCSPDGTAWMYMGQYVATGWHPSRIGMYGYPEGTSTFTMSFYYFRVTLV